MEEDIRHRLAEMMASAGVPHARASLEVLYLMPRGFLDRYVELFDAALRLPSSPSGGTGRAGDLGKANSHEPLPGTVKGLRINSGRGSGDAPHLGGGAGKKGPGAWAVKDAAALEFKKRIDTKLRALGREIRRGLAGEQNDGRGLVGRGEKLPQCGGCGRIVSDSWKFCAGCGRQIGLAENA